jgi:AcrR family transcriptional regulator
MTMTREVTRSQPAEPESAAAVTNDVVEAALRAADELGQDVADVPVIVIAQHAGMSRSTLLRRLGGSRAALDDAVRARGIDPGGTPPVHTRALDAAAELIDENGLAAATLEAIAKRANCSVPSLYAVFSGRDGLLSAVFERHSPIREVEEYFAQPAPHLRDTVCGLYHVLADALGRAPRVLPAILAEALARPTSPAVQSLVGHVIPRLLMVVGGWLTGEVYAGRVRDLPLPLLAQQLMAPMLIHLFMRPAAENSGLVEFPDIDTVCEVFADNFVRAVGVTARDHESNETMTDNAVDVPPEPYVAGGNIAGEKPGSRRSSR